MKEHSNRKAELRLQDIRADLTPIRPSRESGQKSAQTSFGPDVRPRLSGSMRRLQIKFYTSRTARRTTGAAPIYIKHVWYLGFKIWVVTSVPSEPNHNSQWERQRPEQLTVLPSNGKHPSPWGLACYCWQLVKLTVKISPTILTEE